MKLTGTFVIALIICPMVCFAQVSGNIGYSQAGGRARAEANEASKRSLTREEMPPSSTSMFIDANILLNVKADEYVTVFGITLEGMSVPECLEKMDATVAKFTSDLKDLGISDHDIFVDFISQNRIYGYDISGDIAKEKVAGFELKKNISIHHKDYAMLDKLVAAASKSDIFDLIKVDYVIRNPEAIQHRLTEEAAKILKEKVANRQQLLGIHFVASPQIYIDKTASYYPSEMYDAYAAYESEDVAAPYRNKYIIQSARKTRTFFFNPLSAKGFDRVINPVVIEPVVQFTRYLKLRYDIVRPPSGAAGKAAPSHRLASSRK